MKATPKVVPPRPKFERQVFTWPQVPFCVLNIAPRIFIPMIRVQMNGSEHYAMMPEVPTFETLEDAVGYHQQEAQKAMAQRAPKVWAPPGAGKVQA